MSNCTCSIPQMLARSWSMKSFLGIPILQDRRVTPEMISSAKLLSKTCMFTKRVVGHTVTIIQHLESRAFNPDLVFLSLPCTYTFT